MGVAVTACLRAANEAILANQNGDTKIDLVPEGVACRSHLENPDTWIWVVSSFFGVGTMCVFHFYAGKPRGEENNPNAEFELWWVAAFENNRMHTITEEEEAVLEEVYAWLEEEGYFDGPPEEQTKKTH